MAVNEISNEAVVMLPYKHDGKEGRTDIVGAVLREDEEGANKSIGDMNEVTLPLGEGDKRVS